MARVLCVDYGSTRVGLAVSDLLGRTAQPLEVVERPKRGSLVDAVVEVARRVEAEEIVVGLPLRLDGTRGAAAEAAEQFAQSLRERAPAPVTLWDERLSTVEATRGLREAGVSARGGRRLVDKVAAAVILRSYLDAKHGRTSDPEDAVFPEVEDVSDVRSGPEDAQPGGRAAAKRRASEKHHRKRSRRREWRREIDER